jgi:acetyl-CoA carboxylase carboxyltransferase component/biotin carboxyl carrier protein
VDVGVIESDVISADADPLLARLTSWGRDRRDALARLRRTLDLTTAVVQGGATDRAFLLSVLDHPRLQEGLVDVSWLDSTLGAGHFDVDADPVALLAAAVEAYEADQAAAQAAFRSAAARGRPEQPEEVGARLQLRYRGVPYRLRVDQVSPGNYRVRSGRDICDLEVNRINAFERRISCGGRIHRVVVTAAGAAFRLEVDGAAHRITRDDGAAVRAGWPAFVVSVLVSPGQSVRAADPVVVLESMKLESTVTAPSAGEVASVEVMPNEHVDAGAPLLHIRAANDDHEEPRQARAAQVPAQAAPMDLSGLARPQPNGQSPCERVYSGLRGYLLGYDLDPVELKRLLARQARLPQLGAPDDPGLIRCEDSLLDLFADLGALYRPRTERMEGTREEEDPAEENTQEYLLAYLQWLDADRAALPRQYRERLERALERYGVHGLARTPELESVLPWLFRSFGRVRGMAPVVVGILLRRLRYREELAPAAGPELRARFDRLSAATQGWLPAVAELARDVRFRYLDEPMLEAAAAEVYAEMDEQLEALREDPFGPNRRQGVDRLVQCPRPMRGMLLRQWLATLGRQAEGDGSDGADGSGGTTFRQVLLEVYARRFYRIRRLSDVTFLTGGEGENRHQFVVTDYEHEGMSVYLVVAYAPLASLPELSRAVASHLAGLDPQPAASAGAARKIVVDVTTWRYGECPPIEDTASEVSELLLECRFGRTLHRLDVTVTSAFGPVAEHLRTQHLTYRRSSGGAFTEEVLYRNLHPMLAKRLDLWRLGNFRLTRLSSVEDVYLFLGEAYDNPKDRRLFALAEVRDLTSVRDPVSATVSYPLLERMGLQALAAMRSALSRWGAQDRPVANRLVLGIRPGWVVPQEDWRSLIRMFAPLARGVGLEKVVLRVRVPVTQGSAELRDEVLHVEGVEKRGVTVRVEPLGDQLIRPLSEYQQKVLVAQRFHVPYPYEIVRIMQPGPGATADMPPGRFVEHDLDGDGRLVPVERPPGNNTAHLVVGVANTFSDLIPEGITRVVMLSDPTKGLGNLAEPECRRINAALDLAEQMRVPVEWFAVSSGALIATDSGTENMDWIAATLRRLIEFTQAGGEVNIVVTGINVGGQPYWNAEATMLMHTKGILIMTPASAMVLTGKQALDFSGGVSAEDNFGIGGFDRVMGPNGQAQYWAPSFDDARRLLLRHYEFTYVVPGERYPRRRPTDDPIDRDVCTSPHAVVPGIDFATVGEVFDARANPDRKKPFDIRSVLRAVVDSDSQPLERWQRWQDAESSIVWDAHIGGIAVCLLGLESRTIPRRGFVPADGPLSWTSGTLFPQSSRKTARAINAASGIRPLVVLANLSGFDGSPESMRRWQLEYGAEIGRAVTNFRGPIVFVVISRYHGGAFVVFSKALNANLEIAAVEGSYASVIGGAPAAATVFAREVKMRTEQDPRVVELRDAVATSAEGSSAELRASLARTMDAVRSEKLGEVADEFDAIHSIDRALRVGSVDRIIPAAQLRPYLVDALERGMARTTGP